MNLHSVVGLKGNLLNLDNMKRLRVSNPYTLFDSKQIFDNTDIADSLENFPLFYDNQEVSGSGTTTTFNVNRASTTLAVSNAIAGTRIRQTKRRFHTQLGKSQLIFMSVIVGATSSGITKAVGYFDDNNGIFFRVTNTSAAMVIRSNVTGSPVDNAITQSNWNIDKLNGTGSSGFTLDITKIQTIIIDFTWGVNGHVKIGFVIEGKIIYCHEFLQTNILSTVYMSTSNLPLRTSIQNDGTGTTDSIEKIGSVMLSEGNIPLPSVTRSHGSALSINANVVGTAYAIVGVRLRTTHLGMSLVPRSYTLLATTSDYFRGILSLNPTITGGLTYSNLTNSGVQIATGDTGGNPSTTVVTNLGTIIHQSYVSASIRDTLEELENPLRLGSLIDGTRDTMVLSVIPLSSGLNIYGGLNWKEEIT